jgi:hypothetical protein
MTPLASPRRWIVFCSLLTVCASSRAMAAPTAPRAVSPVVFQAAPTAPWSRAAEKRALSALREDAVQRVQALVVRMRALPPGAEFEALERQAQDIKRQSEVDFLRTKLSFARGRGALAAAHELEEAIDLLLNPPKPVVSPDEAERAASPMKGGRP